MGFSEQIKERVKKKAFFRCVICQKPFVEVHHIVPQEEGGEDIEENAAPLCARCHDLYGANPEKRKQIRQMRNHWYESVEKMLRNGIGEFIPIQENEENENVLLNKAVAIYHVVLENEDFAIAAKSLFQLVQEAQKQFPGRKRELFLDIEGHRNTNGGYDRDMFELQKEFLLEFLGAYLTKINTPMYSVENSRLQENDIPDELKIFIEQ